MRWHERQVLSPIVCIIPKLVIDGQTAEENDLAHERWCNHLAVKLLCVSVLDRFGDFVSDQVIQTLWHLLSTALTVFTGGRTCS